MFQAPRRITGKGVVGSLLPPIVGLTDATSMAMAPLKHVGEQVQRCMSWRYESTELLTAGPPATGGCRLAMTEQPCIGVLDLVSIFN